MSEVVDGFILFLIFYCTSRNTVAAGEWGVMCFAIRTSPPKLEPKEDSKTMQCRHPRKEDPHQSSPGATHWEGGLPLPWPVTASCGQKTTHGPQLTQMFRKNETGTITNLLLRSWNPDSWAQVCYKDARFCRQQDKTWDLQQSRYIYTKLYGSKEALEEMVTFILQTGLSV